MEYLNENSKQFHFTITLFNFFFHVVNLISGYAKCVTKIRKYIACPYVVIITKNILPFFLYGLQWSIVAT